VAYSIFTVGISDKIWSQVVWFADLVSALDDAPKDVPYYKSLQAILCFHHDGLYLRPGEEARRRFRAAIFMSLGLAAVLGLLSTDRCAWPN